jgi:hypothetical protein
MARAAGFLRPGLFETVTSHPGESRAGCQEAQDSDNIHRPAAGGQAQTMITSRTCPREICGDSARFAISSRI